MNHEDIPLQSTKSLINSSLVAVLLAVVILFTAVLPAEYGIDPTGLGKKMGLTSLSEIAQKTPTTSAENCNPPAPSMAKNTDKAVTPSPSPDSGIQPLSNADAIQWKDTVKIVIPPKGALEYKFAMAKDGLLEYSWLTDGASIYFDFHGEPKGATDGYFKSYLETTERTSKGKLAAPFEGIHGWYWENETDQPITIQLNTNGTYQVLGVMK